MSELEKTQAIQVLRAWAQSLPEGTTDLREEDVPGEHVLRIAPTRPDAATVEFRIGGYGTFGLYLSAIRIEELPLSPAYLLEICEAVRRGEIQEERWERGGATLRRRTTLRLPSGDLCGTEQDTIRGMLGILLGQPRLRRYASYA